MKKYEFNKIILSKTGESKVKVNPNINKLLASMLGVALATITTANALISEHSMPNEEKNFVTLDTVSARIMPDIEIIEEAAPKSVFLENEHITIVDGIPWYTAELEYFVNIDCEELGDSEETKYVVEKYGDILDEAADTYGMSSNYITGILTQESRGLVEDNLMQIVNSSHKDEIKYVYNYRKNKIEKNVLTDDPSKYGDDVVIYTPESLKEPYNNIMFGSVIVQDYIVRYNDMNMISGLNTYNKGIGNQNKVIKKVMNEYDMTKEEFLGSFDFVSQWLSADDKLGVGDPYYVENVVRFIPNASTEGIYIKYIKDGEIYTTRIYIDKTLEKNIKK